MNEINICDKQTVKKAYLRTANQNVRFKDTIL